jgi:lipopolysaccharide biosynthesis glycosyltransferase
MNREPDDGCIHVVSLADNHYAQHLAVTLVSMLANHKSGSEIRIYVLSTGLAEANQDKLSASVSPYGAHISFIFIDGAAYENFCLFNYVNRETFVRLATADVLPESVDKAICLDSDTVVLGDIAEMWAIDFQGKAVAAVTDVGALYRCGDLGMSVNRYFNAGIYMINLAKWREQAIGARTMEYISRNTERLIYLDQDALNAVLDGDWLEMPEKWNVQTNRVSQGRWGKPNPPGIVHYTGGVKPWHYDCTHPLRKEYYNYLRLTEWKAYKPAVSAGRLFKRLAKPWRDRLRRWLPQPAAAAIRRLRP